MFEGFLGRDSFLRGVTWGDMDKGQIRVVIHKDSGCVVPFPSEPSLDLADETWVDDLSWSTETQLPGSMMAGPPIGEEESALVLHGFLCCLPCWQLAQTGTLHLLNFEGKRPCLDICWRR